MIPQFAVFYDLALGKVTRIVTADHINDAHASYLEIHRQPGEGMVLIPVHVYGRDASSRVLAGLGIKGII